MPSNFVARIRLVALCFAVLFRVVANVVVAVLAFKSFQGSDVPSHNHGALAAWLGLCSLPSILFAPVIGPLAASRWNRAVILFGSGIVIAVLGWACINDAVPWLSVAAILSFEMAFFSVA